MANIYLSQLERSARFLHEHPLAASYWGENCMKRLVERPEVQWGCGHMCRFGVAVPVPVSTG
eukprot:5956463-Alexandrium_andersonii.AAC.1